MHVSSTSAVLALFAAILSYYLLSFRNMSCLASVRTANASFNPSYTPVALFVGGTSGIGQGIAEAFANHTKGNAHIVIIGRNRAAADAIISQLPKPSPTAKVSHEFVQCDVMQMRNVHSVTQSLLERFPKINFLVMSPGIMSMKGRDETDEGIDRKLAVHYYARWKFLNDLLPALKGAAKAGEDAKVLSVLAAGKGGEVDLNDLGLKKGFSLTSAALQAPTYNDLMMKEFAERNPSITFVHSNPGFVRTALMAKSDSRFLNVGSSLLLGLTSPLSTSQSDSGEYMLRGLLNSNGGFFRVGSKGEDIGMKRWFGSEEASKKLWEHTAEATQFKL